MKQEKGITIAALVITVIILIILAGVGIGVASPLVGKAKNESITTELLLIQAKWKVEREKVNFDGESSLPAELIYADGDNKGKLIGNDVSSQVAEKGIAEEDVTYYQLPQEALNSMGLERLDENKGYVVNYENDEIIYLTGVKKDKNTTVYKLSEMKDL